jgi:hypothetical protein
MRYASAINRVAWLICALALALALTVGGWLHMALIAGSLITASLQFLRIHIEERYVNRKPGEPDRSRASGDSTD